MYIFGLTTEHARVALVDNKANVLLEGFMSIFLRRGTVENWVYVLLKFEFS